MTPPVTAAYKPRVFIGSSREHLDLANAIQVNLEHDVDSRVWNQGIFHISEYPLDALLTELNQCDFGILVLAPADVAKIHGRRVRIPLDLPPKMRQLVKTQNPMNGELSHGMVSQAVHEGV